MRKYPVKYGLDVSVSIRRDAENDRAEVVVYAPLYMKKEWVMPNGYKASEFTDNQILNDLFFITKMVRYFR